MRLFARHIHHHDLPWDDAPPWALELRAMLGLLIKGDIIMSKELDDLTAQVKSNSDLLDSATALINGIADRIAAAGTDPAALQALTDELKAKDATLAAAVTANTPSA